MQQQQKQQQPTVQLKRPTPHLRATGRAILSSSNLVREGGGACKLAFDLPVNPIVGLSVCLFSGHHVDEEMLLLLQPTYGMTMTGAERGREGGREGGRDSQSDTDRDCHTSWWQIYESRDPKKERTNERVKWQHKSTIRSSCRCSVAKDAGCSRSQERWEKQF